MRTQLLLAITLLVTGIAAPTLAQEGARPRTDRGRARVDRQRPPVGGPPFSPVVAALDTDQDGTISAAEMKKAVSALATLDNNKDGALSPDELRPSFGPREAGPGEGPARRGEPGPGGPPGAGDSVSNEPPVPKDAAEREILAVLDDMNKQGRGMMSVPRDDGRLLRVLTESLGPRNVVEIGTSHGYSAIWLCLALRTTGGKLTTYEIDTDRADRARANFKRAGVDSIVTLIEGDAHEEVTKLKDPIDLLFLDADKEGYLDYLEKLLPLVRPGGLIVAHNMSQRQADPRYVKAITTDPKLETLFVNLGASGIGVTLKKR